VRTPDLRTSWTPQNAAKEQHKDLCNILQGASVTLHIILLGVGATIYNTRTLKPFKELGLDSQRVKKLASKLHVHSVNFAAKLVHTRRALPVLLSTLIRSRFQAKLATLLIPIDFFSFSRWRSFTVTGTKVAPFPYLMWGVVFTACVVFSFLLFANANYVLAGYELMQDMDSYPQLANMNCSCLCVAWV